MFKLVIVEDEDNIRHSLERFIPWDKIGFQVVNSFSDGSDALAYLKDNPCDAVLTDILMRRMSGLEMIQQLYQIHPQIKVVILSGHSEFAYAQQAIQYNVAHYLVKPVDEDELIAVFTGIREQLEEFREEQTEALSENRELKQVLMKSFFRELLAGRVDSEKELAVYLKLLNLESIGTDSQLYAYEVKVRHCESDALENGSDFLLEEDTLQSLLAEQQAHCRAFLLEERSDCWRVIFVGPSRREKEGLRKHCNQKVQTMVGELKKASSREVTFSLTHSVAKLGELLVQTKADIQQQQMDGALCESVMSDYKLLIVQLDLGSKDTLLHLLNKMFYALKDAPFEDVQFVMKNLYSVVELNYKKRKINVWDITNGRFNFNHLYHSKNEQELALRVKEDFCMLCNGLKNSRQGSEHSIIGSLLRYLNEHLTEDISHDVLATRYRIHPGYLSRLFKQEMGETLSEYLLRIRIERAAQLLKDGEYKIGEIAAMVGYSASSYFSIMFKKYTGYSPREYSQRISLQ